MGHKAADCELNGKCRECGEAGHLARVCPSRRLGRAWGVVPVLASAAPLVFHAVHSVCYGLWPLFHCA